MKKKIQSIKAFPMVLHKGDKIDYNPGMDLRDYFAAHAVAGLLVNRPTPDASDTNRTHGEIIADEAYIIADLMIKRRDLKKK